MAPTTRQSKNSESVIHEVVSSKSIKSPNPRSTIAKSRVHTQKRVGKANGGGGTGQGGAAAVVSRGAPGLRGLKNMGLTCFINVVLQACSCTTQLREFFLNWLKSNGPSQLPGIVTRNSTSMCLAAVESSSGSTDCVLCTKLHHILRVLWSETLPFSTSVKPCSFVHAIWEHVSTQFANYQQQDAGEFFAFLLGQLQEELKAVQGVSNVISNMVEGLLVHSTQCCHCGVVSRTPQSFVELRLIFPPDVLRKIQPLSGRTRRGQLLRTDGEGSPGSGSVTLADCLWSTLGEEVLHEAQYHCSRCKKSQQALRRCRFQRLPDVLIVSLGRIVHMSGRQVKVHNHVVFPTRGLDLSEFLEPSHNEEVISLKYNLSAVIVHDGSDSSRGHYRCLGQHAGNRPKWYEFNDEHVQSVSETQVQSEQAYILVYER
eukprot:c4172_g1_i1.p1 GENE.c4172_g1_i1~~c4172_g1_i1.p1  ORF type:complete len:445 (+),score=42.59 c4172_g1_i1:54-1337(+)